MKVLLNISKVVECEIDDKFQILGLSDEEFSKIDISEESYKKLFYECMAIITKISGIPFYAKIPINHPTQIPEEEKTTGLIYRVENAENGESMIET